MIAEIKIWDKKSQSYVSDKPYIIDHLSGFVYHSENGSKGYIDPNLIVHIIINRKVYLIDEY